MALTRLVTGTTPADRWGDVVVFTYTAVDDTAERKRVQLALMKLDLGYMGLSSRTTTSQSQARSESYAKERADILNSFTSTFWAPF